MEPTEYGYHNNITGDYGMPKLVQLISTVNTTPDSNHVILFYVEEDGVLKLKAKKSDGSVVDMLQEVVTAILIDE